MHITILQCTWLREDWKKKTERVVALIHELIQKDRFCPDIALIMYVFYRTEGEKHGTFRELWLHHVCDSPFILSTVIYVAVYSLGRVIRASACSISYHLVFYRMTHACKSYACLRRGRTDISKEKSVWQRKLSGAAYNIDISRLSYFYCWLYWLYDECPHTYVYVHAHLV